MEKITVDFLEKRNACKEGLDFFKRNNFDKIDWENFNLSQIEGDYESFTHWLKSTLKEKHEYDANGNKIYYEDSNGYWENRKYDSNGNIIYVKYSDGRIFEYDYCFTSNGILKEILRNGKTFFKINF